MAAKSSKKRRLLKWVGIPLGVLLLAVVVIAITLAVKIRDAYDGELAKLFPQGAAVYLEAPDLEASGPRAMAVWNAFAGSRLFRSLQTDPDIGDRVRVLPGRVRQLESDIPAALAQSPIQVDLMEDLIGQGCAAAIYLRPVPPEGTSPAPGEPIADLLAVTRVGRPVRLGGVLFPLVPDSQLNLPEGATLESLDAGWKLTPSATEPPLFLAIAKGLCIVATTEALLQSAVDAAGAGDDAIAGAASIAGDPRYRRPRDTLGGQPAGGEPLFLWLDLDVADERLEWRRHARLKARDWLYNTVASYVNAYQDLMFDLELTTAGGGWIGLTPEGRLSVRAAVTTDPTRRETAAIARPEPAPPAALALVPDGTAVYTSLRTDFRTLWDHILATAPDDVRDLLNDNLQHYPWFEDAVPLMSGPVTLVLGSRPQGGEALPPFAAIIGCSDPNKVWDLSGPIIEKYRKRFREAYADEALPEVREAVFAGAGRLRYLHWDAKPRTFRELGPDFSPGLLFTEDAIVLVSERPFAELMADTLAARRNRPAEGERWREGLAGEGEACHAATHFDLQALVALGQAQADRIGRELGRPDWDAINARLAARGLDPKTQAFVNARNAEEAKARTRGGRARARLLNSLRHFSMVRSLSCRTRADAELTGYRFDLRIWLDLSP